MPETKKKTKIWPIKRRCFKCGEIFQPKKWIDLICSKCEEEIKKHPPDPVKALQFWNWLIKRRDFERMKEIYGAYEED